MSDVSELQSMQEDIDRERVPYVVRELRQYHDAQEAVRCAAFKGLSTVHSRAAAALETLAVEVKELETELECVKKQREDYFSQYREKLTEYIEVKIALAKLTAVVEAARVLSDGDCVNYPAGTAMGNLRQALATLEAAHDHR